MRLIKILGVNFEEIYFIFRITLLLLHGESRIDLWGVDFRGDKKKIKELE